MSPHPCTHHQISSSTNQRPTMSKLSAKVKNVLSGDTVVLVPTKTTQFPVPERTLTLQYVRGDSYQAKEYLRQLVIGKEIRFLVLFKIPASGKEFGDILAPVFQSLIKHMVQNGWVKLKDNVRGDSDAEAEFVEELKAAEAEARTKKLGIWADKFVEPQIVPLSEAIIAKSQKSGLTTVIERVIGGDRVVARIIVNKDQHVQQPVLLAGIKAPRTDDTGSTLKVAQLAKQFVEEKLLTTKTNVKVRIVGENQTGVPLVVVEHPSGNSITEKLLENGYAEVADWQSQLLGSVAMGGLRKAEQTAKALAKGLFASLAGTRVATSAGQLASSKTLRPGITVENVAIARVVSADTYLVRLPSGDEITVQLASLRAPRPHDTTITTNSALQQSLVQTATEFARSHAIGRSASMHVDGFRDAVKELSLEPRFMVSLKIGNKDISEQLVNNGYATVIRHNKQTSGERSANWDRLVELEEEQKKLGKHGVFYSGDISKILTVGSRTVNASENFSKAKTFFNALHKKGRVLGFHIEYVLSPNRVILYNPKEGTKLALLLAGLANDRNEDAVAYLNKKYLQRNVELDVDDTAKTGAFIGNLYSGSSATKPVQVELVESGLVAVHGHSVNFSEFGSDLVAAEEKAKLAHKGIWKDYDESLAQKDAQEAAEKLQLLNLEAAKPRFFDIEVVDIDRSGVLSYHLIDGETAGKFAKFKADFNTFHLQNASASANSIDLPVNLTKAPKKNALVLAKFDENGKYYRAKVVNFDRATGKYEVKHVDFGNIDTVPLSSLRVLPDKFSVAQYKPFAHTCKLQNITLPPTQPRDYLTEAIYLLEDLTFDKKLVLSGLPSTTPGVEYDGILYDAEQSLTDINYTINKQLVSEGFAIVDAKCGASLKEYVSTLLEEQTTAKAERTGCWELGDITEDNEPL